MIQFPLIPPVTVGKPRYCPSCFMPDGRHDSLCDRPEAKAS